ncbi:MAG TPA: FAD binding domain-containing protein, partial [Stellaceae bacterium]|nr:FAD binding domain-containing protein [Stellaceae bacterium]
MKPAPFDYERPATLAAALALLKNDSGTSKVIAGGQSLVPMMNFRIVRPDRLIDINRISELDYHRIEGSDLVIGALCRHAALKESDLVKQACPMMQAAY